MSRESPENNFIISDEASLKLSKEIILCVLSENLNKLSILKNIYGWSENDQTIVEYKPIEYYSTYGKHESNLTVESKDRVDLVDFQKDCSFIEATLQKTFKEIYKDSAYKELKAVVKIFNMLQVDETSLLEDTERKDKEYVNLRNMVIAEKRTFEAEIDDAMVKIGSIKDEIEDFVQQMEIKKKYITSWQAAKAQTTKYVLLKKEETFQTNSKKKRHDFIKEERVHQEVQHFFHEIITDMQREIKKWKLKYEYDLHIITEKIKNLQEKRSSQQNIMSEMSQKYNMRQEAIDKYKKYKLVQEEKRKEKQRKDQAATKIQAWWRGVMVRKGFGKYKKKKDKKGKKSSPEKKK